MRGDERSFPVRVHGPSGETRRHRTSIETGLLQSTEERRYFRRGLCQLSRCLATLRDFLVWYNNRDVVPFLQAIDRQFAFYQQRGIDMFKQGISVPGLTLLYLFNDLPEKTYFTIFNEKNKDLHHLVKDHVVGGASLIFHRYHEKGVTTLRQNEYGEAARPCRSIVGYDANALYLWSLMQDMPMGWYTRRREENDFRPESALYGQMAAEWLTWESERTRRVIRHQINVREKRIGKLLVDGWCSETKTADQFHGCFFHGHSCTGKEVNEVNGKPTAELLTETRKNIAYLRHFVKVVELWECEWKETRRDPVVKKCLDAAFPRRRHVRWTMTSQQILSGVRAGTVFGLSTPRCACCSSITTSSTGTWSALFFSAARRIQTPPIWPWPPSPSTPS